MQWVFGHSTLCVTSALVCHAMLCRAPCMASAEVRVVQRPLVLARVDGCRVVTDEQTVCDYVLALTRF
jgi:hypothetical protein